MRWLRLTMVGLLLGVAGAAAAAAVWSKPAPKLEDDVPLYFSLEVRERGHVVARPQLVGSSGHDLRALLRQRDGTPRMSLLLQPTVSGQRLGLDLQLDLPDEHNLDKTVDLHHAEETSLKLSRDVEVKVLAMRVRSPEFEAYIAHAPSITGKADPD